MTSSTEEPNTFLWVLRGLSSAFLLGYLLDIFLAVLLYDGFPAGNLLEDLIAIGFLVLFGFAYYLMWIRKELLTGFIFLIWYLALWPAEILIGGDNFKGSTVPGSILFVLGILFLVYRVGLRKRQKAVTRIEIQENHEFDPQKNQTSM